MTEKRKLKGVLSVERDGWENGHQRGDFGGKCEEQKAFGEPSILFLAVFFFRHYSLSGFMVLFVFERFLERYLTFFSISFCYFIFWYVPLAGSKGSWRPRLLDVLCL